MRPSYLKNGNSYVGMTTSLYWDGPLVFHEKTTTFTMSMLREMKEHKLYAFFDLRLNKRLSKQSWGWWFKTLSFPLWRHCNARNPPPPTFY